LRLAQPRRRRLGRRPDGRGEGLSLRLGGGFERCLARRRRIDHRGKLAMRTGLRLAQPCRRRLGRRPDRCGEGPGLGLGGGFERRLARRRRIDHRGKLAMRTRLRLTQPRRCGFGHAFDGGGEGLGLRLGGSFEGCLTRRRLADDRDELALQARLRLAQAGGGGLGRRGEAAAMPADRLVEAIADLAGGGGEGLGLGAQGDLERNLARIRGFDGLGELALHGGQRLAEATQRGP
jgi:hypothetical protein